MAAACRSLPLMPPALAAPVPPQLLLLLMTFTGFLVSCECDSQGWGGACATLHCVGSAAQQGQQGSAASAAGGRGLTGRCAAALAGPPAAIPVYFEWIKWVSYLNYSYAARECHHERRAGEQGWLLILRTRAGPALLRGPRDCAGSTPAPPLPCSRL